jgi:type IV secretory pathway VirB3-like protein
MKQATGAAPGTGARRSPWIIGIIIMFAVIVVVNVGFIYIAVKGADQVVPSYLTEER